MGMIWRILTLFILCFIAQQSSIAGTLSWISQERWVTIKRVIDGDTFITRKGEKVRLLGINTPETRHDTSPAQPFGNKAKRVLQQLVGGKQVRLSFDKEKKDKYKRTLAHVYLRDGLWVNAEMVRQGLAHVYTFTPNIREAKKLVAIEHQAMAQQQNMWSHKRWKALTLEDLDMNLLGQFRLIKGLVTKIDKKGWRFSLGKLTVSIPKKYRSSFRWDKKLKLGETIRVRGRLRMSKKNRWFLSIHTPSDVAHIK